MRHLLIALVCFWKTCSIVDGTMSACPRGESGTPSEMGAYEERTRGPGKLFLRECVADVKDLTLHWENIGIFGKELK